MPLPDVLGAILRKWWVFLPVLAIAALFSFSINGTGAEYLGEASIAVVSPRTENTLLDSASRRYTAPAILAAVELGDDEYRDSLRARGLPDRFEFDYSSEFPLVLLSLRGPTAPLTGEALRVVAEDYAARVDQVQADRNIIGAARLRAEVASVIEPFSRPPGSTRALFGLLVASVMLAAAAAYGVDQFLMPARASLDLVRT